MLDTLTALKPYITPELRKMTPEQLCIEYKTTHDDHCIAAMYEKMFGLALEICHKYPLIESEEAAAAVLEVINELMLLFEPDRKLKFVTLFFTGCSRKMYAEMKPYTRKKRICTFPTVSLNDDSLFQESSDSGSKKDMGSYIEDINSTYQLEDSVIKASISLMDFTPTQKCEVAMLMDGYKPAQIAKELKIERSVLNKDFRAIKSEFIKNGFKPNYVA